MNPDVILKLLSPFESGEILKKDEKMITKVDFFQDKLTGFPDSSKRRAMLCEAVDLPFDMTPNRLLEAMNLLYGYEEYKKLVSSLFSD